MVFPLPCEGTRRKTAARYGCSGFLLSPRRVLSRTCNGEALDSRSQAWVFISPSCAVSIFMGDHTIIDFPRLFLVQPSPPPTESVRAGEHHRFHPQPPIPLLVRKFFRPFPGLANPPCSNQFPDCFQPFGHPRLDVALRGFCRLQYFLGPGAVVRTHPRRFFFFFL